MPWDNPSGYETTVNSLAQMCLEKQERRKKTENVYLERKLLKDLRGGPGLKDPSSYAGDMGSETCRELGRELRCHMPQGS